MKKYEGLFILNTAGKETGVQEIVDRIRDELTAAGVKIEGIQKMDKKPFARVTNKRVTSGVYVNFLFQAEPAVIPQLPARFERDEEVYRLMITLAPRVAARPAETAASPGA